MFARTRTVKTLNKLVGHSLADLMANVYDAVQTTVSYRCFRMLLFDTKPRDGFLQLAVQDCRLSPAVKERYPCNAGRILPSRPPTWNPLCTGAKQGLNRASTGQHRAAQGWHRVLHDYGLGGPGCAQRPNRKTLRSLRYVGGLFSVTTRQLFSAI